MKKSFGLLAGAILIAISSQVAAGEAEEVGAKIYERAFGRGCGACHDIASNPQLKELIKAGKLPKDQFATVLKNGKNGMPKAMEAIMAVGPVKKAGYTEDQAIDAVYSFLSQ
ncbi:MULTISPECIES: c-type cytochrome [Methylomonas]|uniref:c-type cytochrome n=1 Tax=Methylomonas TaxID=416 RepID=UPI001231ED75|nr:cytochrome c [Methylomonas rhizoryzae]